MPKNKSIDKSKKTSVKRTEMRFRNDDSDLEIIANFSSDLFSLEHYIDDRDEMIEQVFSSIEEQYLKKMLPPLLTKMPLEELKDYCLAELKEMGNDEIKNILTERYADCVSSDKLEKTKKRDILPKENVKKDTGVEDLTTASSSVEAKPLNLEERSLLELQLRARAIQSALRQCEEEENEEGDESDTECNSQKKFKSDLETEMLKLSTDILNSAERDLQKVQSSKETSDSQQTVTKESAESSGLLLEKLNVKKHKKKKKSKV